MKQHYIGFDDSDKFLAAVDRTRPVNLMVGRKNGKPDKYGMSLASTVLTISQATKNEALYFETVTHRYQSIRGEIFASDKEKPSRLAEQVRKAAEQYLAERGVTWRDALLSMPLNYITMNGEPTFLRWDKETETYSYRNAK